MSKNNGSFDEADEELRRIWIENISERVRALEKEFELLKRQLDLLKDSLTSLLEP